MTDSLGAGEYVVTVVDLYAKGFAFPFFSRFNKKVIKMMKTNIEKTSK